jgi:tetratricopeptide (TPR) repeat protein
VRRTFFLLSSWLFLVGEIRAQETNISLELAEHELALGQYAAAIDNYTCYLRARPNSPVVYERRAECYFEIQQYDRAAADYSCAIELGDTGIYANRADAYFHLKRYGLAIADYNRAISLFPQTAGFYESRGDVYQKLRLYYQALADYTKAIALFGIDPGAYVKRGDIYLKLGRYNKAVADYAESIDLRPNEAFMISAWRPTFAELWVVKFRFYPDDTLASVYRKRANAYEALGNSQAAERDRREANYLQP